MPRTVTVTFDDGSQHVYQGVPDAATPDQVQARASQDFGKNVKALDGGASSEAPETPQQPKDMSLGRQLLGNVELGGSAVANIPYGLAHAATDIYNRVTGDYSGKPPGWVESLRVPVGQAGQELSGALSDSLTQTLDKGGVGGAIEKGAGAASDFAADHPYISKVVAPIAGDVTALAGARVPLTAAARAVGGVASRAAGAVARAVTPLPTAEEALRSAALRSPQSMGAAAAAPSLQNVSPELKTAISKAATQSGGAVNADTLSRHIQADTLPVPIKLTAGQATQDPVLISNERNLRGTDKSMVDRLNEQNQQLKDNLQAIRDQAGPDVFTTSDAEHGGTVMDAYRAVDAKAQKAVAQKYQALRDANGGQFPLDAQQLWKNVQADLHQKLLYGHAPAPEMVALREAAEGRGLTFEQFENLRTNLARTMRSSADGNTRAAAGVIRSAMEDLPLSETAPPKGGAQSMLAEFEQGAPTNPANPAERLINGVRVEMTRDPFDPQAVHVQSITAPTTGQGAGTAALQAVTKLADKHGVRLTLDASPAAPSMSTDKLTGWYGRNGFQTMAVGSGDVPIMERLPAQASSTAQLKALADDARSAARTRFQAIEADPAYKAVVQGKIKPENFLRTYVLNGTPDKVAKLAELTKENPQLKQTLTVAVTDYLKKAALPSGEGNFSQAGYNRALAKLSPVMKSLVDPKVAEQLQNLGEVARNVQIQPAGAFVNNSNTFTAAAGHAAGGVIEHAANSVVPFAGTVGRAMFKNRIQRAASQRALEPGAGLRNLISDTGRPGGAAPVGYRNQLGAAQP